MSNINYKRIISVQRNMGNGITEPKLATSEDGQLQVIKTIGNPEGEIVLFNEFFFYKLAIAVGITMPTASIGCIDGNTEIFDECICSENFGYCFCSSYIVHTMPLVGNKILELLNKEEFYKIILFDHLIYNSDRNPGNLLLGYSKDGLRLYSIDHSHVLPGQSLWNSSTLKQAMKIPDYFNSEIMNNNKQLYKMFTSRMAVNEDKFSELKLTFRKKITDKMMRNIVSEIPSEWLPRNKDIDIMIEYLLYRLAHINEIIGSFVKFLDKQGGYGVNV